MSIIGAASNFAHSTTGRVALVGGGLAVAAVTLTACGGPKQTPQEHYAEMLSGVRDATQGHLELEDVKKLTDKGSEEVVTNAVTYGMGSRIGHLYLKYEATLGKKDAAMDATLKQMDQYIPEAWD